MSQENSTPKSGATASPVVPRNNFLGFSTEELAGLSVQEIVGNEPAVKMVMHYYRQLSEENAALKNDLNTATTYVSGYELKRVDVSVGAGLQFVGSLFLAFAVNILTGDGKPTPGYLLLVAGVVGQAVGLYFSLRREKK
jgi:hypothetical protein